MKVQKLGLVLGVNMAVACMMMQGCKAVKAGSDQSLNETTPVVDTTPTTSVAPVESTPSTITTTTVKEEPVPGAVITPAPTTTKVAEVKPISSQPEPKKPAAKPAAAPAAAPAVGGTTYVVAYRDTLSAIAYRNHVKMSAIVAANPGLNPNKIRVGQKLVIPAASAAAPTAVAAAKPEPSKTAKPAANKAGSVMLASKATPSAAANTTPPAVKKSKFVPYTGATKEYTVKSGDTLGKLATENGISIRALKELNGLTKDSVRVGQKLQVPAQKVAAEAKPAAAKPAAEKKVDAKADVKKVEEKKADAPAAKPAEKKVEEKPAAAAAQPAPAAAAPAPAAPEVKKDEVKAEKPAEPEAAPAEPEAAPAPAVKTHVVGDNEDVVGIAINYGIAPAALQDFNGLKAGDKLTKGQVLKIPAK